MPSAKVKKSTVTGAKNFIHRQENYDTVFKSKDAAIASAKKSILEDQQYDGSRASRQYIYQAIALVGDDPKPKLRAAKVPVKDL